MTSGKRSGGRHAGPARLEEPAPPKRPSRVVTLLLALGITAAMIAWGYLVYIAIDFGTTARDGDDRGWWYLGLATAGAIACLVLAMTLGSRFMARLRARGAPAPPRHTPGRRAAR